VLFRSSGSANLYLSASNPGDHHVFDTRADAGCVVVPTQLIALDDHLDPAMPIDFIKIDIQGAEPAAMAGMQRTLERQKNVRMLVEFWPSGMTRAGFDAGEFLDRLESLGFSYLHVDQREKRLVPVSRSQLLETEWIVEKSTNLFVFRD